MGLKLNGATSGSIEIDVPAVAGTDTAITIPATTGGEFIVSDSAGDVNLDNGTFFVDASTNRCGIGTTSPGSLNSTGNQLVVGSGTGNQGLTIFAGSSSDSNIYFADGTAGTAPNIGYIQYRHASDRFDFGTNDTTRMSIDSSGRLLVGTSTDPTGGDTNAKIAAISGGPGGIYLGRSDGNAASNQNLGQIVFRSFSASTWETSASIQCFSDGVSGLGDKPGRLVFSTTADGASSPTERMRINSNGNVLIGTTNDTYNGIGAPAALTAFNNGTRFGANFGAYATSSMYAVVFSNPNGQIGGINLNGTTTSFVASSDYRLKENVVDLDSAITRVKQLAPKRFNFIADATKTVDGFLAHEAQTVVPEAVTGTHNEVDDEGNPVYQGIDQSKLVPLLTAALQEAIAKIETLETKVSALEGGAA